MSASSSTMPMASEPRWKTLSRWQAFGIHLTLSVLVFATLVALMVFFWFPGELFLIDGGWQGLKLVAIVDLVLGPLLTLMLWKPGKKDLVMDMSLVAAIQVGALVFGFITTYDQRTVAMVYADKAFSSVSHRALVEANEILVEKKETPQTMKDFERGSPTLIVTPQPTRENYGQYLEEIFNGYPEPHERSDRFIAVKDGREHMEGNALTAEDLSTRGWSTIVEREIAAKGIDATSVELHEFNTRYANGVAVFDPQNFKILDYIPIDNSVGSTATAESVTE